MHATIRRYEGVDTARTEELTRKVSETLVPQLQKLEGFGGYYLIEAGNGVFTSVGLFKTPAQTDGVFRGPRLRFPERRAARASVGKNVGSRRHGTR